MIFNQSNVKKVAGQKGCGLDTKMIGDELFTITTYLER